VPNEIEIFAAGTHTSSNGVTLNISNSDLDAIARSYSPQTFEAPAVVGHPRDNSPAYGWVESVRREGGKLLAKLAQVDPEFEESVKAGRYKKISASFYSPDSSANPKPGNYYLRHVGFLGGMAPAVKGLKSVAFAEEEAGVIDFCNCDSDQMLWRNLREWLIDEYDMETADRIIPSYFMNLSTKDDDEYLLRRVAMLETSMAQFLNPDIQDKLATVGDKVISLLNNYNYTEEMPEELTEQNRRIEQLEEELAAQKAVARKEKISNFVESLVRSGKLLPAESGEIIEFMCSLDEEELEFSECGKSQSRLEWIQGFLIKRPKLVDFREVVKDCDDFNEGEIVEVQNAYVDAAKAYESAWRS
jgi:hypothetical protein